MTKALDINEEHSDLIDEKAIQSKNIDGSPAQKVMSKLNWTGDIQTNDINDTMHELCDGFNNSPFLTHNAMRMQVAKTGHIECVVDMSDVLIGNVAYGILHGGVAATMLDSVGGIEGMLQILAQDGSDFTDKAKKISRLATVDMRVDYLAPGRGKRFVATAEVIRMGRKGCTCQMTLKNDENKVIAVSVASYAF